MLTKAEAATFLGVSTRSIERLIQRGSLSARYIKGQGRPTPYFEQADLDALKVELDERLRPQASSKVMAPTISFRLADHDVERLREAGERHGLTAGGYARTIVIDALEGNDLRRLQDDLTTLKEAVAFLAEDLASVTLALLLHAGQIDAEADARTWITDNLHSVRRSEGDR